ncbi:hypothetical protein FRB93_012822 [Tulasnella sp. JGI-2019a]|nr:hypothetical protein FRB93_012822 [Tulasnella sp. JGI-2019a]
MTDKPERADSSHNITPTTVIPPDRETRLITEPKHLEFRWPPTDQDQTRTLNLYNIHDRALVFRFQFRPSVGSIYRVTPACNLLKSRTFIAVSVTMQKQVNKPGASQTEVDLRLLYTFVKEWGPKDTPIDLWARVENGTLYGHEIKTVYENSLSLPVSPPSDRSRASRASSSAFVQRALSPPPIQGEGWTEVLSAPYLGNNCARRFKYGKDSAAKGKGGFAYVLQGVLQLYDRTEITVAIKHLDTHKFGASVDDFEVYLKLQERLIREISVWQGLNHENIAPLLAYHSRGPFCFLTHWYEYGDIAKYVKSVSAPNAQRLQLLREVARGLQYLHINDVIHGDVKSDNIVVTKDRHAIIIDFGFSLAFASEIEETNIRDKRSIPLPNHRWMAPELIQKEEAGQLKSQLPGLPSDVFSFACVALEIASNKEPFKGLPQYLVIPRLQRGETSNVSDYPTLVGINSRFWDLLLDCWKLDPMARPPMEKVLAGIESLNETDIWKQ